MKIDPNKTTLSKDYRGSGSFATFLIIGPVCFFLGILFASFPYDFPLLWSNEPVSEAFLNNFQDHLIFMNRAPPLIARMLHMIIGVGFLGFLLKLYRASISNYLFDGASLMLYVVGTGIYITNIIKFLAEVDRPDGDFAKAVVKHDGPMTGEIELNKEDRLRVFSASNTILAFVLVGVLVLQAAQWYGEKREREETEELERMEAEKKKNEAATGGKKHN
ncbi:Shr3 amino acid permease chaperone [Podospora australis]|uniref:Shr3 amino acid permease chaperone n=1 Tax=Podospora australis TaxID=1536484 RepID=A0AAN6X2V7_9PEZI|nr:Shr3 amino acid permease chaperone [Podospora australis]